MHTLEYASIFKRVYPARFCVLQTPLLFPNVVMPASESLITYCISTYVSMVREWDGSSLVSLLTKRNEK